MASGLVSMEASSIKHRLEYIHWNYNLQIIIRGHPQHLLKQHTSSNVPDKEEKVFSATNFFYFQRPLSAPYYFLGNQTPTSTDVNFSFFIFLNANNKLSIVNVTAVIIIQMYKTSSSKCIKQWPTNLSIHIAE